jgi:hypothetical protein
MMDKPPRGTPRACYEEAAQPKLPEPDAFIDLDSHFHWIDDRGNDPRVVGRWDVLVFVGAVERRWRVRGFMACPQDFRLSLKYRQQPDASCLVPRADGDRDRSLLLSGKTFCPQALEICPEGVIRFLELR